MASPINVLVELQLNDFELLSEADFLNIDLWGVPGLPGADGAQGEPGSVTDEAYTILDLSTKILGNVPASQPGAFIDGVTASMTYTRVGRTVSGNLTIVIPSTAVWPSPDPFFPIGVVAIKAIDLPYPPKIYPAVEGIAPPQVGGFGLFNVTWTDGMDYFGEGFSVGSVITDFGGSLADGGIFSFFHAGNNTVTQLTNLVYDGNFVNLPNRDVIIYNRFEYEAAEAA